jgi:glycosyltransferase involved in cell wall biosynthesis
VVVPANDEEELLPAALRSVVDAVAQLRRSRPEIDTSVTVVLDACIDGSRRVAEHVPEVTIVEIERRSVGAARAHGVALATGGEPTWKLERQWLASTDADCVVPSDWLVRQVVLADAGVDLVIGTVEPDGALDPEILARWWALHELRDGHPHVHGANLGIRLSTYVDCGGFEPVAVHEDVRLVERIRRSGAACVATSAVHVRTSGRTRGRTVGGFADYLAAVSEQGSLTR